jgi:hypothetical protein
VLTVSETPTDGDVKIENGIYYVYASPPGEWQPQDHAFPPPLPPLDAEPPLDLRVEGEP